MLAEALLNKRDTALVQYQKARKELNKAKEQLRLHYHKKPTGKIKASDIMISTSLKQPGATSTSQSNENVTKPPPNPATNAPHLAESTKPSSQHGNRTVTNTSAVTNENTGNLVDLTTRDSIKQMGLQIANEAAKRGATMKAAESRMLVAMHDKSSQPATKTDSTAKSSKSKSRSKKNQQQSKSESIVDTSVTSPARIPAHDATYDDVVKSVLASDPATRPKTDDVNRTNEMRSVLRPSPPTTQRFGML